MKKNRKKLEKIFAQSNAAYYICKTKADNMTTSLTVNEMIATGTYDEKKIAKFHARQMKLNGNNEKIADAMVRIYLHTFEIRIAKRIN